MADVSSLTAFVGAYGTGVRAGAITPCVEDEAYMRDLFGLPSMPESVRANWQSTGNIRRPITLAVEEEQTNVTQQTQE